MRKFYSTLRIAVTLIMARTFGAYSHSGWNGVHDFAQYRWRGKTYSIPTAPDDPAEGPPQ